MALPSLLKGSHTIGARTPARPTHGEIEGPMATRAPVARCAPEVLHLDRLPRPTQRAFRLAVQFPFLARGGWYLAGGTALALQVGHRRSVDLDFFTPRRQFQVGVLERRLIGTGRWALDHRSEGTLYGRLDGAKVSFIAYPFFAPVGPMLRCGSVRILRPEDIAAMKIIAISQRGRKRDFVDLYWYVTHRESLTNVVRRAAHQYPGQTNNLPHIIKSLAYFTDAEDDPMPTCFFDVNWRTIKAHFRREVPKVAWDLLGV